MIRHTKYRPYIRKANGKEKAATWRDAMRLAAFQIETEKTGRPHYVMLQRGCGPEIMNVGWSRRDIVRSLLGVRLGKIKFRNWARFVQKKAGGR